MIKNKTVLVDFTNCEHIGRIHPIIKEAFGFPDEYGENWSAFRDFLFWEYPVSKVIVKGASSLPTIFYNDMNIFRETLEDMKKECESKTVAFEYEFEQYSTVTFLVLIYNTTIYI